MNEKTTQILDLVKGLGAHGLRGTADAVGPTRHEIPDY